MKNTVVLCVIAAALLGCNKPSSEPKEKLSQKIEALEKSGKYPVLDRSPSIPGSDSNANGIRDDIDRFIALQRYSKRERAMVEQLARALQQSSVVGSKGASEAMSVTNATARAIGCLVNNESELTHGRNSTDLIKDYQALTMNTKERTAAFLKYDGLVNGQVIDVPEGDTCDK